MGLSKMKYPCALIIGLFVICMTTQAQDAGTLAQEKGDFLVLERDDSQIFILKVNDELRFTADFHGRKSFPDLEYVYDQFLPALRSACYSGIDNDDQITAPKLLAQFRQITTQRNRELKQYAEYLKAPPQTAVSIRKIPFLIQFAKLEYVPTQSPGGRQETGVRLSFNVVNLDQSSQVQKQIVVEKCHGKKQELVNAYQKAQTSR
jgi:hypothetical protein